MGRIFYTGAYAHTGEPGISAVWLGNDGSLRLINDYREMENPSYLARSSSGCLYAVSERMKGGEVEAFRTNDSGSLIPLGRWPVSGGAACHVAVSPDASLLAVSNYMSGIVDLYRLEETGAISERICVLSHKGSGPVRGRQEGPHAHCTAFHPTCKDIMFVADLGCDKVWVYEIDRIQRMPQLVRAISLPPGCGPRHIALCPDDASVLYIVCELGLCVYTVDISDCFGRIIGIQPCMQETFQGIAGSAAIKVEPSKMRVYTSTRAYNGRAGEDCVACYLIDEVDHTLMEPTFFNGIAAEPRDIALMDDYLIVACQSGGKLMSFEIDNHNGIPTRCISALEIPGVCCIC